MSAGKASPTAKKATGRLGTQLRGKLQKDYAKRGKSRESLWYAYSPKYRGDVVLHGDVQYYHFLHVESDPDVEAADYDVQTRATRIVGEELGQIVNAELRMTDGAIVWRCVRAKDKEALATQLGNFHLLISRRVHSDLPQRVEMLSSQDITANPVRMQNWNRLLPYLAQARVWPLHECGNEVALLLHTRDEVALCDVVALADAGQEALYVAALLDGVQHGRFRSDLNENPWGLNSRFWVVRS